ncbi:MAG: hypothetical protein ACOCX7_03715 [Bacteroidota bacterium]
MSADQQKYLEPKRLAPMTIIYKFLQSLPSFLIFAAIAFTQQTMENWFVIVASAFYAILHY